MKRGRLFYAILILAILTIVIFIIIKNPFEWNITGNAVITTSCTDSDGGLNYTSKGITKYIRFTRDYVSVDYCINSTRLREYKCDELYLNWTYYNCVAGCNMGACKIPASCIGKTCGSDGYGGSCGTCASGQNCIDGACINQTKYIFTCKETNTSSCSYSCSSSRCPSEYVYKECTTLDCSWGKKRATCTKTYDTTCLVSPSCESDAKVSERVC